MKQNSISPLLKIVTVEDSPPIAERVQFILNEIKGLEFLGNTSTIASARNLINTVIPDIVILDINIADNDLKQTGIDLLSELRGQYPQMKIIIFTNRNEPRYRFVCLEKGANYFFDKSSESHKISEVIKQWTIKKIKILLLEDNPDDAWQISHVLKKQNLEFELTLVGNRENYLKELTQSPPDIIISDHYLPSFNSSEALDMLMNQGLNIPFILVTGAGSEDIASLTMKKGATDYILKDRLQRLPSSIIGALQKFKSEKLHKEAELEVWKNEKKYTSLIQHLPANIAILNKNGVIVHVNNSWKLFADENGLKEKNYGIGSNYIETSKLKTEADTGEGVLIAEAIEKISKGELTSFSTIYPYHSPHKKRWFKAIVSRENDEYDSGIVVMHIDVTEQQEAQLKVKKSEANLLSIFNNTGIAFILLDTDLNIVSCNKTANLWANDAFGFNLMEGDNLISLIHEDKQKLTQMAMKHVLTGMSIDREDSYSMLNGSTMWFRVKMNNVHDDRGVIGLCLSAADITAEVSSRNKVVENEKRFKALVQEGSDLIGILDTEGNYTYVSPTSVSILGIAPEEFTGRNACEFIHTDDVEQLLNSLQKITTQNKVTVGPYRFQNSKKEWRWIETVLTNMLTNPAVKGIVANSRDVTEKINTLKQIEGNELFNRTVLESSPDCYKVLDVEGQLQFMNFNGLCQMEIDDFEIVKNKNWWTLWGSENEAVVKESINIALKGETAKFIALCPTAKGIPKWWDVSVSPVGKPGEPVQQIISVSRDVTEQKIKEQEKELLAQISVNFNTENDFVNAGHELCKSVSMFGKFDWVELWITNLERNQMQLFSHYVAAPQDELFYEYSHDVKALQVSEGSAGKVWSKQTQLLWNDIENNKDFVRRDAAKKIGLKAVLGIPLVFNNEVVGVLQIGTKHNANYLKNYSQMFKKLEGYIGSELNRKKLENDLSHLYQAIPDILCLGNFKGQFLKINKAGCELLGYTEQEIINHNFEEFVHPEDKENMINDFKRLIKEGTNSAFESRYITKSGAVVWLSWTCNSSSAEGLIYATAKNITEEKKLRELNRQANSLAKIGSWELNLVNQVLYWSDEVHQLHETDPKLFEPNLEEAINFYREDFRETVQLNIKKSIATGAPFDFEVVLVTAKRKELWVRSIGKTEFVDGECTRIFGSFQDIDIRKKAEIERNRIANDLLKNIKNLEQFTYIVSHNLRAPVANILGLASVLKNKINETDKERAEKYLFTAVAQMDETIKDLNKILQIRGEYSEFKEPIYLPDLLKDIQSSIQDIISKESVIIRPAFGNVSTLTTIKSYMQSVFYNLILNSIKYRKKGAKPIIEIRSELNNERVRLIFKDNGSGIDLEKHGGNIFGLYKRFHMDVEGKGLGLFMIKTQIEVMGGSISVKSIPNEGAEFTVELPLN